MNTPNRGPINYNRVVCSKSPAGIWEAHYILFGTLWEIPMRVPAERYNRLVAELREWYPEGSVHSMAEWSEVRDPAVLNRSFYRNSNGLVIACHDFEKEMSNFRYPAPEAGVPAQKVENSGGHCEYYHCPVDRPQNANQLVPYIANCEDLIQSLGMTFDEGCEFKSLWRRARARQGFHKAESSAVRDARKAVHYATRVLAYEEAKAK